MKQNTAEWIEMRRKCIGASDAPIIMEESPYGTPYQLWQEKVGIIKREQHAGMRYGHEMEPIARRLLEDEMMCLLDPQVIFHPDRPWMMASLDALNVDMRIAAEIKNPNEEDHELAKLGKIPKKYVAQLQHQLDILFSLYGINHMYYFSHRKGDTSRIYVERDEEYISRMITKEYGFWVSLQRKIPPRLSDKDYLNLSDDNSKKIAAELSSVSEQIKSLKERENNLKEELICVSGGRNAICGNVKLTKVVSKGSVDYSRIPELSSIDLDQYRKPTTEHWRVSC